MAGAMKRTPDFTSDTATADYWRYMKLSKADWADAYADLYRQVFGEMSPAGSILFDAEHRTELLKGYRKAEAKRDKQDDPYDNSTDGQWK